MADCVTQLLRTRTVPVFTVIRSAKEEPGCPIVGVAAMPEVSQQMKVGELSPLAVSHQQS